MREAGGKGEYCCIPLVLEGRKELIVTHTTPWTNLEGVTTLSEKRQKGTLWHSTAVEAVSFIDLQMESRM